MSAIVIRIMQETVPLDYTPTAAVAAAAESTGPAGWYKEPKSERGLPPNGTLGTAAMRPVPRRACRYAYRQAN